MSEGGAGGCHMWSRPLALVAAVQETSALLAREVGGLLLR